MRPVEVAAWGLCSHLGSGRRAHLQALRDNQPQQAKVPLNVFGDPLEVPLLLSPLAPLAQPAQRLRSMLTGAVDEALTMAQVSDGQRAALPLYIGSSSFAIGVAEETYLDHVRNGGRGVPLPEAGFGHFLQMVRDETGVAGPDWIFNTACTASANALLRAATAIARGRIEQALVIGIEVANYTTAAGFAGMQLLAAGPMRPFDLRRDGLVLGEGCAAVLLRAASSRSRLLLSGGSSRCDTYSISASNPDGSAIAEVMTDAMGDAEITPSQVVAVKGHGTASPLNDDGEAAGLQRVFGDEQPPLFLLKSLTGHTLGACGAIETALLAEALGADLCPGSAGFEQPDPNLKITPRQQPTPAAAGHYLLNFFGFGGNNCTLVLDWRGGAV